MKGKILLIILFSLLFLCGIISTLYFQDECYVEKASPCVDGDGDINLEGIMCKKDINTCSESYLEGISILSIFIGIIGLFIITLLD